MSTKPLPGGLCGYELGPEWSCRRWDKRKGVLLKTEDKCNGVFYSSVIHYSSLIFALLKCDASCPIFV